MCACVLSHFSHVPLFVILSAVARQAPLSMGFSQQEYWSGLPFSPSGDLPEPGIKPASPALAARFCITGPRGGTQLLLGFPVSISYAYTIL